MNLAAGDSVVGLALNAESIAEAEEANMADELEPADPDPAGPDPDGAEEREAE
jgi:hypothetical protein